MPITSPIPPPIAESMTLSVSNWRMIRPRPAPMAARIVISRLRTVARTSSRFATFAHAISRTKLTAPSNTHNDERTFRTMISCIGSTPKPPWRPSALGKVPRNSFAACCSCALAAASVIPGFSRPAAWKKWPCITLFGSTWKGSQMSGGPVGDWTASESNGPRTPTTSCGSPLSESVRPTTIASPPNRRFQKPSLKMATRPPFGRSSAAAKVRPATTGAPKSRKKSALTSAVATCSGSPSVRLTALNRYAETS